MCLYVEKTKPGIARYDIKAFKVLIKDKYGNFHPYFDDHCEVQFDTLLTNNEKIHVSLHEPYFPYKHYVASGVFHTFTNSFHLQKNLKDYLNLDNVYVCEAIIPKGTEYFIGFSHSFSHEVEHTYGSHKIIYKNPVLLTEWLG